MPDRLEQLSGRAAALGLREICVSIGMGKGIVTETAKESRWAADEFDRP